ncbi:MAG TPA: helix-turn-helix domain-containing protein [Thermoleophilaceae bacterium]|nr:helix-turn-helix domain-containing protein [Thermoleophilaceae bacterium]
MLTVPEAARRVGRNAETVRRWIRTGRLRSEKVGTQHLIDEVELDRLGDRPTPLEVPGGWGVLPDGSPAPDWATVVRRARDRH